jgi:hypothetical protein
LVERTENRALQRPFTDPASSPDRPERPGPDSRRLEEPADLSEYLNGNPGLGPRHRETRQGGNMIEGFRRSLTRRLVLGIAAIAACTTFAAVAATVAHAAPPPALFAGGTNGIVFAHGAHGNPHHGGNSPQLVFHGGPVLASGAAVTPIFWGSSWSTYQGDKVSGIDGFYAGVGGTAYAKTTSEYSGSNGPVGTNVSSSKHLVYSAAAPSGAPSTSQVLAVVAANISNPVANGYYPVYSDQPRGHAGYCAWHSWGTIGSTPVQFAFFFNLDGDPGCDPSDTSGLHSEGLAALGNVSGHELSETLTDPNGNAWYDSSGAENADKCAWTFSGTLVSFKNSQWKIQGNWSNIAYTNGRQLPGLRIRLHRRQLTPPG